MNRRYTGCDVAILKKKSSTPYVRALCRPWRPDHEEKDRVHRPKTRYTVRTTGISSVRTA